MKHLAAYLLLNLAGKTPNESNIKSLLDTVGIETDDARLKQLLGELDGKDIDELVNSGLSKLASVPTGGGGAAAASSGAAAGGATAEAAPAEEAKKEEEKEESDDDMGFGLFD
ncbi:60s acidic ribosomal protein [Glomus cerebriforme]|uniref:60s acidic ribosomal protein n=1 Tax=Glomus cerebriforme TaxID=658196 RepID=A0A397TGF6_9GLOM|nr:60s acidic ribosomal protein [Glomus cerebriforme]